MAKFDSAIIKGTCSVCGKFFRNTSRKINIAIDKDDNKLYCMRCALDKIWAIAVGMLPGPLLDAPREGGGP